MDSDGREIVKEVDLLNITALRRNIYSFISRGFSHEIDQGFLDMARKYLPMLKELEIGTEDSDYINSLVRLEKFLDENKDDKDLIEEYAKKFVSIFLNVFAEQSKNIQPFESVYLSPERLIMQEPRDQVVEFYAEYGHGVSEKFREPEDHIAAELGFLSSLNNEILKDIDSDKGIAEIAKKLEGHLEFMKKHLLIWLPMLSSDLKDVDPDGLYGILGELALGFCRVDAFFLEELTDFLKKEV